MHEMSIAVNVLEQVLDVAAQADAVRVTAVELEVGGMQQVVPEAMEIAWEACVEGTLAEGAELTMTVTPVVADCRKCRQCFEPDIQFSFACPRCHEADVEVAAGNDIVLKTVVCETEESGEA